MALCFSILTQQKEDKPTNGAFLLSQRVCMDAHGEEKPFKEFALIVWTWQRYGYLQPAVVTLLLLTVTGMFELESIPVQRRRKIRKDDLIKPE